MNHARIHGDPFGSGPEAGQLRNFLRSATAAGMKCSLSLSGVPERVPLAGEREIPLTDGSRNWTVGTGLPSAEIDLIMSAAQAFVCSTAPLLVFAPESEIADAQRLAGLEWPRACAVVAAGCSTSSEDLISRVRGELRWAGTENPRHALSEWQLRSWIDLPFTSVAESLIVHVAEDSFAGGTDLMVAAFVQRLAPSGRRLRLVLPTASPATLASLRSELGPFVDQVEICCEPFAPVHVCDAAAIVLPMRQCSNTNTLVLALASGRPVCASRFKATADVLDGRGIVHAIGGRNVDENAEHDAFFAPHPGSLIHAIEQSLEEGAPSSTGHRARGHVVAELTQARPACAPPVVPSLRDSRPTVVLEAPIFETSSTAELTLATAVALQQRGVVDLRIVPTAPFRHDLTWLRQRAPQLESNLCRNPGRVDLWLSAGWPARAQRPDCRTWALRIDWEFGALPMELTPHATQEADLAIVHSEHVYRTMTAAGRPMSSVKVVPHGVDPVMTETAEPSQQILAFKGDMPAVLFCGGLVWRKGFDVFLQAVLAARAAGNEFVVIVKSIGSDQHYGRTNLAALLDRFGKTPGTPPLMVVEDDLTREQLASVYTACDLMLHPYRGEGFCMPVLEARACGLPVLATGGGATDILMQGPGATKLTADRRAVDMPGAHISMPWVLEPDGVAAGEDLCSVLADLPEQQRAARQVAPAMREAFTWDHAAMEIEECAGIGLRKRSVTELGKEPVVTLQALPPRVGATTPPDPVHPLRSS